MEAMNDTTDAPVLLGDYVPTADQRIVLHNVGWAGYRTMLALRGDRRSPRIHYLAGAVELMATSRHHEVRKSAIGCLAEVYMLHHRIPFSPYGSWTLDDESEDAGAEPDECYIAGRDQSPERPHLAIEVIWTHGGIDKLEIYRRLGVREVWMWKRNQIDVYLLEPSGYVPTARSELMPGLDLALVCELLHVEPVSDAILKLREILERDQPRTS